jgi:hypothetical protein
MPAAPLKRSRPESADEQPQPLPTRPIPLAVWEDHLLSLLDSRDAARLRCTCKALSVVVREHVKDLRGVKLDKLQAALTTFPRARSVGLREGGLEGWGAQQREGLVTWMRGGGHGRGITTVRTTSRRSLILDFVHSAVRRGALPSLKGVAAVLGIPPHRATLTRGLRRIMHELRLTITRFHTYDFGPQLAALGLVRELPALAKLEVVVSKDDRTDDEPVEWPPFIPPSLKALRILTERSPMGRSLLPALPDVLEASGARPERLEIILLTDFNARGDGLVHLAQAVRCCARTLKILRLVGESGRLVVHKGSADYARECERLREEWVELLAGVSTCRELEVLALPAVKIEPLFPPGTAFTHLTHLEISDFEREHPPGAGVMGPWELMASGRLPALTRLKLKLPGGWKGAEEVKTRMAPAFEAVAGTLTHLYLATPDDAAWVVEAGYELGVAVGKLRRLKDLALGLTKDGQAYHAVAQGLAASGGDGPPPFLWRVGVVDKVCSAPDLLASLLLPSVRVFVSFYHNSQGALLTACALRQVGYKHTWAVSCPLEAKDAVYAIAQCRFSEAWYAQPPQVHPSDRVVTERGGGSEKVGRSTANAGAARRAAQQHSQANQQHMLSWQHGEVMY